MNAGGRLIKADTLGSDQRTAGFTARGRRRLHPGPVPRPCLAGRSANTPQRAVAATLADIPGFRSAAHLTWPFQRRSGRSPAGAVGQCSSFLAAESAQTPSERAGQRSASRPPR
jgi:hypothetical protein